MTNSPDQVELVPTVVTLVALRSSDRPHRGRRLVLIPACALALYLLGSKLAHDAQLTVPAPAGAWGLVFSLLAIAGSLMALERLDADEV